MPDQPFDRTIFNPLEKPLSEDFNISLAQVDRAIRFFAKALFSTTTGAPVSGFTQGGFRALESGPAAMSVVLKAGLGFQDIPGDVPDDIDGVLGLDDFESYKPLPLLADLTISIPTAPTSPNSRIDIIEVRADRLKTDTQSRKVFNNATKAFSPTSVDKTLEFLLDGSKLGTVSDPTDSVAAISLKQGVAGTPGIAPTTTVGYIKVAEVFVDGDVILINQVDITDTRPSLTERTSKIHWPASDGFLGTGVIAQEAGGAVLVNATGVWYVNLGEGLEAGDLIVDFVTVMEKTNATSNELQARLAISEVDLDAETHTVNVVGYATTGAVTVQKVYTVSHATAFPAEFPFEWKAGYSATMQFDSDSAQDRIISVHAIVRRPLIS